MYNEGNEEGNLILLIEGLKEEFDAKYDDLLEKYNNLVSNVNQNTLENKSEEMKTTESPSVDNDKIIELTNKCEMLIKENESLKKENEGLSKKVEELEADMAEAIELISNDISELKNNDEKVNNTVVDMNGELVKMQDNIIEAVKNIVQRNVMKDISKE